MSRFPLNLQLFAGGENEPDPADPVTGTDLIDEPEPAETPDDDPGEGGEGGENEPAPAAPAIDQNAIYAQARRAADRRMNELDSRVASRFGNRAAYPHDAGLFRCPGRAGAHECQT